MNGELTRYVQCPTANYISLLNTRRQIDIDEYQYDVKSNLQTDWGGHFTKINSKVSWNKRFYKCALKTQT